MKCKNSYKDAEKYRKYRNGCNQRYLRLRRLRRKTQLWPEKRRKQKRRDDLNRMDFEKEGQGLRCVHCPICKREFYPTTIWVWKIGDKRYCRYSCMRVDEKKLLAKKKETSRKSEEIAEARAARRAERMHNKYMEKKTGRQDCG